MGSERDIEVLVSLLTAQRAEYAATEATLAQQRVCIEETLAKLEEAGVRTKRPRERSCDGVAIGRMPLNNAELLYVVFESLPAKTLLRAGLACKEWLEMSRSPLIWLQMAVARWPSTRTLADAGVVRDYVAFYRSRALETVPEPLQPRGAAVAADLADYWLLIDLPNVTETTPFDSDSGVYAHQSLSGRATAPPFSRAFKLDSLGDGRDTDVNIFEQGLCSCDLVCDHPGAWLHIPIDEAVRCPSEIECIDLRISLLRASTHEAALIMDPQHRAYKGEAPELGRTLGYWSMHSQVLCDLPSHLDHNHDGAISLQVHAGIEGQDNDERRCVAGHIHIAAIQVGFETHVQCQMEQNMPIPSIEGLARFLEMAGVRWH